MCGIFGYFGDTNSISTAPILTALSHRGPDDQAIYHFEDGFLVHTRLSIIDVSSNGRQPMSNHNKKIWIVFNGEIYNYLELKKQLPDYPFKTKTDTEVILAAYEKWDTACLQRLRGMFAFAIIDREKNKVFCATDRFSIKPLYYYYDSKTFIFSSEIKPLLHVLKKMAANYQAIYHYLSSGALNYSKETFFKNIEQIPPAHYLISENNKIHQYRYWDLEYNPLERYEPHSLTEELKSNINDAFNLHMRSDVEIGVSLSSGLDSNYILNWMTEETQKKEINCFTFSYQNTNYDEVFLNPSLNQFKNINHFITPICKNNLIDELKNDIYWMEEPSLGLLTHAALQNYATAKKNGIKVLLDGQGADEIFGGYQYYYHRYIHMISKKNLTASQAVYNQFKTFHKTAGIQVASYQEIIQKKPNCDILQANDATSMSSHFLTKDFSNTFQGSFLPIKKPTHCDVKNAIYNDLFYLKIPRLLRFQDKASMSQGVEVRVPFLDHKLVEYIFNIPTLALLQNGQPKFLLRQLANKTALSKLSLQPKLYVSTPQREWIRASKDLIMDRLNSPSPQIKTLVDIPTLKKHFMEYCETPTLGNSFFIWKYLNIDLWFEIFS